MSKLKPADAEFEMGDWSKPHELRQPSRLAFDGKKLGEGLAAITCSCGWRVTSSPQMAARLAESHLDRAKERGGD